MRLVFGLLLLLSSSVQAHRSHFGWTEVALNGDTVEIVHRVHEHDAALLVSQLTGTAADIAELENQARFALYMGEHFSFFSEQQQVPLNLLGAELKGRYLFVYQDLSLEKLPAPLTIKANALMNLFEDQIHLVNIDLPGINQTLEFTRDSESQTLAAGDAHSH